jgi:hypothetical protein
MIAGWSPGIGDPTPLGWLTVAGYALACVLSVRAASRDRAGNARLWLGIAVFLASLAINKQLDLQSLLTALAREGALAHGWYQSRRPVQALFVLVVMALSAGAALWLLTLTRRRGTAIRVASLGVAFLLLFVIVRAASFHHMDAFLRETFVAVTMNHLLEIGGIALVGLAAAATGPRSDALRQGRPADD